MVKAEFLRGAVVVGQDYARIRDFLDRHTTVWPDETTLSLYAQIYANLHLQNQLIGPHDRLIFWLV